MKNREDINSEVMVMMTSPTYLNRLEKIKRLKSTGIRLD